MTVYLLHFEQPIGNTARSHGQARHYIGYAPAGGLDARLDRHANGSGAAIMSAVAAAGIGWRLVRTWPGGRDRERQIKRWKCGPKLCPACAVQFKGIKNEGRR